MPGPHFVRPSQLVFGQSEGADEIGSNSSPDWLADDHIVHAFQLMMRSVSARPVESVPDHPSAHWLKSLAVFICVTSHNAQSPMQNYSPAPVAHASCGCRAECKCPECLSDLRAYNISSL